MHPKYAKKNPFLYPSNKRKHTARLHQKDQLSNAGAQKFSKHLGATLKF